MKQITRRVLLASAIVISAAPLTWQFTASEASTGSNGTLVMGEVPGNAPNYILPLDDCLHSSSSNIELFQRLMFRPLYWYGVGPSTQIDKPMSLASPPKVTDKGRTFTIQMKGWRFHDGQVVDAQAVQFYLNLLAANPNASCSYDPGFGIPDRLAAVQGRGNLLKLTFSSPQSPNFITGDFLSQITPLPLKWSRAQSGNTRACAFGKFHTASTDAACRNVYAYLSSQAQNSKSFDSTFWQSGVDGPYQLRNLTSSGQITFDQNPNYGGPRAQGSYGHIELVPFSSEQSVLTALQSHRIDVGRLDIASLSSPHSNNPTLSANYTAHIVTPWETNFATINFTPGAPDAAIIDQQYIRQALQLSINQKSLISNVLNGFGVENYGPLPPTFPIKSTSSPQSNLGFNLTQARSLLVSHGWSMSSGSLVCSRPGEGAQNCGVGIPQGAPLSLRLSWVGDDPIANAEINSEVSTWRSLGVEISSLSDTLNNVATSCNNTVADICYLGTGFDFSSLAFPSGEQLFLSGGQLNFGDVNDAQLSQSINKSVSRGGTLVPYVATVQSDLPVLFEPVAQVTFEVMATIRNSQMDVPGVMGNINPELSSPR